MLGALLESTSSRGAFFNCTWLRISEQKRCGHKTFARVGFGERTRPSRGGEDSPKMMFRRNARSDVSTTVSHGFTVRARGLTAALWDKTLRECHRGANATPPPIASISTAPADLQTKQPETMCSSYNIQYGLGVTGLVLAVLFTPIGLALYRSTSKLGALSALCHSRCL